MFYGIQRIIEWLVLVGSLKISSKEGGQNWTEYSRGNTKSAEYKTQSSHTSHRFS